MLVLWPADSWVYWPAAAAVGFAWIVLLKRNEEHVPRARRWFLVWAYLAAVMVTGFSPTLAFVLVGGKAGTVEPLDVALVTGAGLVGVASLFLGAWAVFGDRARGRRRCPKCWYDLSGSPGLTCSECGYVAKTERRLLRTRRRRWWAVVAVVLGMGSAGMGVWARVRHDDWRESVPTTALILAVPWLNDNMEMGTELALRLSDRDKSAPLPLTKWQKSLLISRVRGLLGQPTNLLGFEYGCRLTTISGTEAADLLPQLLAVTTNPDVRVRRKLPTPIWAVTTDPATTVEILGALCTDADEAVRTSAYSSLLWMRAQGPPVPPPRQLLDAIAHEKSDATAILAVRSLAGCLASEESISLLVDTLRSPQPSVAGQALITLSILRPDHPDLIPTLRNLLESDDPDIRIGATSIFLVAPSFTGQRNTPVFTAEHPGPYVDSLIDPLVNAIAISPASAIGMRLSMALNSLLPTEWRMAFFARAIAEPACRSECIKLLPDLGPEAGVIVPRLREMLETAKDAKEKKILEAAIWKLGEGASLFAPR